MEKENSFGRMVVTIKDKLKTIKCMAMENYFTQMELNISDNFNLEENMAMASTLVNMDDMQENGYVVSFVIRE